MGGRRGEAGHDCSSMKVLLTHVNKIYNKMMNLFTCIFAMLAKMC